jgi:Fe2+ transport system protein FeoA
MTLSELPVGKRAVVRAVHGERGFRRRLLELGLVPGTELCVQRVAPLGDPLAIVLRGSTLSLRRAEACGVEVEVGA